jgi:hypothetical protein
MPAELATILLPTRESALSGAVPRFSRVGLPYTDVGRTLFSVMSAIAWQSLHVPTARPDA